LLLASGCKKYADPAACQAILDRYVRMGEAADPSLHALPPAQVELVLDERVRARRTSPAYADAATRCTREVGQDEARCALRANSPNEWEACLE
jgi:hypothetical protein